MKYRYCALQIEDLDSFRKSVENMGGQIVFNAIFANGVYQCWFDLNEPLQLDETVTFMMLQCGVQLLAPVKVETY